MNVRDRARARPFLFHLLDDDVRMTLDPAVRIDDLAKKQRQRGGRGNEMEGMKMVYCECGCVRTRARARSR